MRRALELARHGEGYVEPNPMVGCVVAHPDRIVGEGYHQRFGGAHAESVALEQAGDAANNATLYVTLEPCCHYGKTPPCTDAIIRAGIRRVVAACADPFPAVQGSGFRALERAGLRVEVGLCQEEAVELLAPYLTRLLNRRPWVIAKYAMTWDGKIATHTGQSRWISSEASRQVVQQLRGRVDAIAVGRVTVERDDPLLLARPPGPRIAARVVFDSHARLSIHSQLIRTIAEAPVQVVASHRAPPDAVERLRQVGCTVWQGPTAYQERLVEWLAQAAQQGITNLLVEGGAELLGTFVDARCLDEVHLFLAPKLLGGRNAPSPIAGLGAASLEQHLPLAQLEGQWLGSDWYCKARLANTRNHWYTAVSWKGV